MMMMPPGMINPGMIGMNMSFPFGMMEKKEIDLKNPALKNKGICGRG